MLTTYGLVNRGGHCLELKPPRSLYEKIVQTAIT